MQGYQDQGDTVEFSGPLLSQSNRIDELLERHERQIRQAVRKSWFQRGIMIRVYTVGVPKQLISSPNRI